MTWRERWFYWRTQTLAFVATLLVRGPVIVIAQERHIDATGVNDNSFFGANIDDENAIHLMTVTLTAINQRHAFFKEDTD